MAQFSRDRPCPSRRTWLRAVIFVFGACMANAALLQDYPSRPIPIIVSFPAGGTPGQFADFMHAELVKWGGIVRESGTRVE